MSAPQTLAGDLMRADKHPALVLYGNSYWSADALAGYTVSGLKKGRALSFQLNIINVTNERDPLIKRYSATDPSIVFRQDVRSPTTWRLTSNLEF